jgi:hypothetical protein
LAVAILTLPTTAFADSERRVVAKSSASTNDSASCEVVNETGSCVKVTRNKDGERQGTHQSYRRLTTCVNGICTTTTSST